LSSGFFFFSKLKSLVMDMDDFVLHLNGPGSHVTIACHRYR
jgi:hypothetical protein